MKTPISYVIVTYNPTIHKDQSIALFSYRPDIFPANEMIQIKNEMGELGDSMHCKFVCVEGTMVLGYLGALLDKDTNRWFLDWFSVHPNYQGISIGSALLKTVEDWLLKNGVSEVRVQTCSCEGETNARDFYTKKLFLLEDTEKDGYAPNHSKLTYIKTLIN